MPARRRGRATLARETGEPQPQYGHQNVQGQVRGLGERLSCSRPPPVRAAGSRTTEKAT
ncbi:hypothetical protein [Streptomyces massasporeus]|uniref:hypothetical protein n=1 Tax=Streptomyces massasporeus TaxID=67324 RepID=UPI0037F9AF9F